jgi:hypothetical protein
MMRSSPGCSQPQGKVKCDSPDAPEFRRRMVELVHAGRRQEELAAEFETTAQSIRN